MPPLGGPFFAMLRYTTPVCATSYLPWMPLTGAALSLKSEPTAFKRASKGRGNDPGVLLSRLLPGIHEVLFLVLCLGLGAKEILQESADLLFDGLPDG